MYNDCTVYGPYCSRRDGRYRVVVYKNRKRRTISYPKYLMELHLGRYLLPTETIDHIDGDVAHNTISNFRVLTRREHCRRDGIRNKPVTFVCPICGKSFCLVGLKLNTAKTNRLHGRSGPFCSKKCRGQYSRGIQLGTVQKPSEVKPLILEKFKIRDI